jgi:hypothetical protein
MQPWMIGTPFAVVGIVLVWIAVHIFTNDSAMKSWPTTDGVIVSSAIETAITQTKDQAGHLRPWETRVPKVRYSYTVNAKQLEGTRITREPSVGNHGEADQWIKRYPVGKAVKVYYDPNDPTSSVLEFKTSVGGVLFGAIGAFFLLLGVALFVVLKYFVKLSS